MAVPPRGSLAEEMLMVPGHRIPTEKPQTPSPYRRQSKEQHTIMGLSHERTSSPNCTKEEN